MRNPFSGLYWPELREAHRSYYRMTLVMAFCHLLYVLDAAMGLSQNNPATVFQILFNALPVEAWTFLHALCAGLLVVGMYTDFKYARIGYLLSVSIYWALLAAFVTSFFTLPVSLYGLTPTLFVAILSSMGYMEHTRINKETS